MGLLFNYFEIWIISILGIIVFHYLSIFLDYWKVLVTCWLTSLDPASDWYSASVPVIIHVISYNIGLHYNGIQLYTIMMHVIQFGHQRVFTMKPLI